MSATRATARKTALTPEEQRSPLARRVYDLRHACLSMWLNAGVHGPQVAEWAGHGVDVLLAPAMHEPGPERNEDDHTHRRDRPGVAEDACYALVK